MFEQFLSKIRLTCMSVAGDKDDHSVLCFNFQYIESLLQSQKILEQY